MPCQRVLRPEADIDQLLRSIIQDLHFTDYWDWPSISRNKLRSRDNREEMFRPQLRVNTEREDYHAIVDNFDVDEWILEFGLQRRRLTHEVLDSGKSDDIVWKWLERLGAYWGTEEIRDTTSC